MKPLKGQPKEQRGRFLNRDAGGFTLIETTIALVVMMVTGLAVAPLFVYAVKFNTGAYDRALSVAIVQQRLERLRKTPFSDPVFSTASTTETVVTTGRSYTVVTNVCNAPSCGGSPALLLVTVQVTPAYATGTWANTPVTAMVLRAAPGLGAYYQD